MSAPPTGRDGKEPNASRCAPRGSTSAEFGVPKRSAVKEMPDTFEADEKAAKPSAAAPEYANAMPSTGPPPVVSTGTQPSCAETKVVNCGHVVAHDVEPPNDQGFGPKAAHDAHSAHGAEPFGE